MRAKTLELSTLGSYQTFGVAFPYQDENSIEIYTGAVLRQEFDLIKDPVNYTAITSIPTEFYKIDLTNFMQLVQG